MEAFISQSLAGCKGLYGSFLGLYAAYFIVVVVVSAAAVPELRKFDHSL